ncbi:MAG: Curculin protein [Candidatus Saccharibacteria bacterium]|nr:Curculin protein [Candidatus Saccharibacteria bacterium]
MKMIKFALPLFIFFAVAIGLLHAQPASAAGFEAGRIIDDGVFTDASSMGVGDIQQFLNSKVPICDTNGTQTSEYGGGTRAQWGQTNYGQSTFTCLKDYSENGRSSAQIIYDTAQQYGINPKVILVLLQKEQSLVTDTWPLNIQYRSATGYGCPDTSVCDSQYYGLTNQVTWAAKMFRAIINDSPTWYTPYVLGDNYIQYSPDASCGGSTVTIVNRATQALYNYTPYQPNAAAIAAGWGSAPCGAYGNRNFYLYYTNWFGSTTATPSYGYSVVSRNIYSDSTYQTKISDTPTVEPNSSFYVKLVIKNTGNQVWYKNSLNLGGDGPQNRASAFASNTWFNAARPATINEASVGEGGTATFNFKMTAPTYLDTYSEQFGVLIEGNRWLSGILTIPVTVASSSPYYSIKPVSFDAYSDAALKTKLNPSGVSKYTGDKIYIKAVLKNTGNQTYPISLTKIAPTNPLNRSSIYADSSWANSSRVVGAQEGNIAPGENGTYVFSMTAPSTPQTISQEQFGVVIEGQQWLTDNIGTVSIQTVQRPPSELNENQTLQIGDSLLSYDERYWLVFQGDGNLVLYSPNRAVWSTQTQGKGGVRVVMQNDGNLVMYRADWTAIWNNNSAGKGTGSRLIPQTDGNLVTYTSAMKPTWWSGTNGQQ